MKFEAEIIKEIVDSRGHEKTSIHYQSECVEEWVKEVEGAYPKLCDYQPEWLNYSNENKIGVFPYTTLTDVTDATVENVVPYAYKSAVLKGSTKYRDIDTGDVLDTFDETKNLELVSVQMPVLTTTGKNLFDGELSKGYLTDATGQPTSKIGLYSTNYMKCSPNSIYTISGTLNDLPPRFYFYDSDKNYLGCYVTSDNVKTCTTLSNAHYMRFRLYSNNEYNDMTSFNAIQIEEGSTATPYEPYKSNILTVNEDVTLRGIGDVRDELNLLTGELTERIGEITFDGSDDETWGRNDTLSNNYETSFFTLSVDSVKRSIGHITKICDKLPALADYSHAEDIEGVTQVIDNQMSIRVLKTSLSDDSVEGLKAYLQSNPITVQYQFITKSVKTVDLSVVDQDGNEREQIKPIEGTMHLNTSGETIKPLFSGEIPVEAITQNLASFIEE